MSHKIRGATAAAISASAEQAIQAGSFEPGASLPPIRALAVALGVSPVTVAAAYRRLRARGLLVSDGRRGTRVAPRPPTPAAHTSLRRVASDLVDLANGNPDPALLPPLDTALRALDPARPLYGAPPVMKALAEFVAGEFEADGIPTGPIVVTSGSIDAIERILREHLRPGDTVAVEDPATPGLLDLLGVSGFTPEPVEVDEDGPLPSAIERALGRRVRALVITPRAQDPTGAALTPERAVELRRLLRQQRDLLLVEHDAVGAVSGAPAVTLAGGGPTHWAVVRSTSAFLGPDLRVAVATGDAVTMSRIQGRQELGTRWVSHLLQELALALWSDPANGRRLARAAEVYAHRRQALLHALAAKSIAACGRSGFNVWIPVREETPTVQGLAARGWAVAPGERFRLRGGPAVRVTTSALEPADAARFAEDLRAVGRW